MKNASLTSAFKKGNRNSKDNYRSVSILPKYVRLLRDAFFVKYSILWINFCQNTNAVFAKVTTHSIVSYLKA